MASESDQTKPKVTINKSAWRLVALGAIVITLALSATLVGQTSLSKAGSESDPLTTVALVLTVLAFLIQIFVFAIQTKMSSDAVIRTEDLNAQARGVLEKIEANSSATQKVLFAQFDRLLDYIVDGRPGGPRPREKVRRPDPDSESGDTDEHVSRSEVAQLVSQAVSKATDRPSFSADEPEPSAEDMQILDFLSSWPSQAEGEMQVAKLTSLSPLCIGNAGAVWKCGGHSATQRRRNWPQHQKAGHGQSNARTH